MIARTRVPPVTARVGAGLYHAVRHDGGRMRMSMPCRTYEGVNILCQVALGHDVKAERKTAKKAK